MFNVEVTYRTRIGNLGAVMTSSATLASRPEAEELRTALRGLIDLAGARISITNAKPHPTVDEAFARICKDLAEYPPTKPADPQD